MIVIDTSALVAMLLLEPKASVCSEVFNRETEILISAGTVVEALIVARRRNISEQMTELLASPFITIVDVDRDRARLAGEAFDRWGKSINAAALNFGDCFSYATAREFGCPLLFIGDDFARTDIVPAIAP
ncbi:MULTISPECIES: type II toxin-antitoxin system VapC family toxin [Rhizobium]|uniref:Ribonuclease VapC n=2 Tax=Rhizobium TaxID=379 RepID=A0AAF1KS91_9HYPH|nr:MULTISPECIES: type II toxin-antitoxin system VapC family toxin [Rhizobium]MBZ5759150.1 type II toxin-antitoxin system VapC family toxin [Rhizobium sp. VS19-DR96]MBZ5764019.1 type II toxin-antitoxin system VapC family toxin [Rhizobium sp. VS19-DR129.2]MBZ5771563.1 type II toxin-antitoxin system VapC family toxin [Rhizobium sp. VS19-DRK62.2]MBZ5783750.1 type II toxin-antitoxin system VapC family toxin [Rhizobium sp. VS19-DR121]MBZ5801576.1 type II toxin-antitoxin system VapC family toxin [Rhi